MMQGLLADNIGIIFHVLFCKHLLKKEEALLREQNSQPCNFHSSSLVLTPVDLSPASLNIKLTDWPKKLMVVLAYFYLLGNKIIRSNTVKKQT